MEQNPGSNSPGKVSLLVWRNLMRFPVFFIVLAILSVSAGCGSGQTPSSTLSPVITQLPTNTSTASATQTMVASPTLTLTPKLSETPAKTPTQTKTQYPRPDGISTRSELQGFMNDWLSGKTVLADKDRLLDEKSGLPLRLGMLGKQVLEEIVFIFYNIGFTIVEDKNGTPFLLNLVGFENGRGERFAFPFHTGKLFTTKTSLILGEYTGKRIGRGQIIFQDRFTPLQYVEMGSQFLGFVNIGTTVVGSEGKDSEIDRYAQGSEPITQALVQFLECSECSLQDIPKSLEALINNVPEMFEPDLPYLMIIKVGN